MARIARVVVPDIPHHVTQRGIRRQRVFFNDADNRAYLVLLAVSLNKTGTEVWAYCPMPNHVHLIMVPKCEDGLRATLIRRHQKTGRPLGNEGFVSDLEKRTGRVLRPAKRGPKRKGGN